MSEFSEAIKEEIKKSGQTLLYLSDASGLSLDHISKMRQGKRLPQDTEKVRKLIMALQCSEKVTRNLFSLYKIERMGSEEWSCMQEIKKILESTNSFLEPGGENEKKSSGKTREECRKQDIHVLHSRTEVLAFLEKMLPQCGNVLRMSTEEVPEAVVELLALYLNRNRIRCEHLFSLKTIREQGGSLYNLQYINRIMPLIRSGKEYVPCYDYEEIGNAFFPNWLISAHWAIGLQRNMESGLIIWEAAKISYLQKLYESKKKNTRHLLRFFADVNEWGEWVSENRRQYLCEMEKSNLRPQDVKNYYMEYNPCILRMLTEELLSRHLLPGEAEKSMLIGLWKMRKSQMDQERAVRFFTREGLEYFARTGVLSEIPEQLYTPVTIPERITLLENFLEWMKEPDSGIYMIDERQFNFPEGTFVYSTVSLVHNELTLYLGREGANYCSIFEQGVSEELNRFCHMMEDGEMICTLEEGEKQVLEVIEKLRAQIN